MALRSKSIAPAASARTFFCRALRTPGLRWPADIELVKSWYLPHRQQAQMGKRHVYATRNRFITPVMDGAQHCEKNWNFPDLSPVGGLSNNSSKRVCSKKHHVGQVIDFAGFIICI